MGMKCGKCGAFNPDYTIYCGKCGSDLSEVGIDEDPPVAEPTQPKQTSEPVETVLPKTSKTVKRFCSKCGKEIDATSYTCPFCGEAPWDMGSSRWSRVYDTRDTYSESDWRSESDTRAREKTSFPILGGIFAILAGVFALGMGLLYMAGAAVISLPGTGALCLCGGIFFLFGAASVFGGVCALKRDNFTIAVIGSILGMLGFGFLIGFLFGLLAVIFIVMSKDEFE